MKKYIGIIILVFASISCKNDVEGKEVVLLAAMDTPMGHNSLKIYRDHTFLFEHRRLLKTTHYKGSVNFGKDTLSFKYEGSSPDFGKVAIIDGVFLTYTDGIYRELLEISINNLTE